MTRAMKVTRAMIEGAAKQVSLQPIGLVRHTPESWAEFGHCFRNVMRKVAESGGRAQYGWTFHHRLAEKVEGQPLYLYVTHHAVWVSPRGELVDVTPYPDTYHEPIKSGTSPIFLLDDGSVPREIGGHLVPLPLRFFAFEDAPGIADYIAELNRREQAKCEELCRAAAAAPLKPHK